MGMFQEPYTPFLPFPAPPENSLGLCGGDGPALDLRAVLSGPISDVDVSHPERRATIMGVYRFWRDLGYTIGALISGVIADLFGMRAAIEVVAVLTFLSGMQVALRMRETLNRPSVERVAQAASNVRPVV